ncbi:ACT domain-containing protein [Acidiplasma cupricumulans]|uniref:ACT domain-containing protein n=1 Tax=Acidiplasma cupricumulans TaxID=312540 RepID=UPI001585CD64|nr:ACT domain-containing protein [Acidiplasma cupricumulans]
MVFSTSNTPGALYRVLSIFDKYSINMSKIESRPVKFNPFNYIFFVDIENNKNTENAINEIKKYCRNFKDFGNI